MSFIVFHVFFVLVFVTIKCVVVEINFGRDYILVDNSFKYFIIDFPRVKNVNQCFMRFSFYIHVIFQINLVQQFTCHPFF